MNLFKKKTKCDLKDFCTQYYDTYILVSNPPVSAIKNFNEDYSKIISEKLIAVDNNFKSVDIKKFSDEILIIRFELFSLAWFHQFGDKSSIQQTIFTNEYLIKNNRVDIWYNTESYTQAIAQSATHDCDDSTAFGRTRLISVATMRQDLFDKYYNDGFDALCVARALNKYGTQSNWQSLGITLFYLVITLCKNLNYTFNEKAGEILGTILKGFYDGCKQSLEKIKVDN
jgi:hypothetical protein